ncbi:MAG: DUF2156 domain-containing protein, partial [Acidimicrobiales bacterium]|nr:DUF2156 domain-containing protein [Acidimicrobiales bacterium]
MTGPCAIPDLLQLDVPVGGRVLVVSDLHLTSSPSAAQLTGSGELVAAIEAATGPGVLILAGNLIDSGSEPRAALSAHSRLARDIADYARGEGRRVIVLPGDRDVELAWSEEGQAAVETVLGAELAIAVELRIRTGAGERRVRVEPGHRLDPLTAHQDPRNPLESPFAQHIRHEVLPAVRRRQAAGKWLNGLEQLDDPAALSRFIASRLVYRRLVHFAWLLPVPIVVAIVLGLPATALRSARAGSLTRRPGLFVAAALIELLLLVAVSILAIRATNAAMAAVALDDPDREPNEAGRALARELVTGGYAGLVSAHTCRPELTYLGDGFYANPGAGAEVVTEYPSRLPGLGLPSVFLAHRILSWVEMEAGNDLHVRLLHARQDLPGAGLVERIMARRIVGSVPAGDLRATVVATFPQGEGWPRPASAERHDRRVRRLAAALLVVVGFISLVSAMSDPLRDRLNILRDLFPLVVPETAAAVAAFVGVALIVLARGIRRGQRRAWVVVQALLLTIAVLNLVKGVDVEESVIALVMAFGLWTYRSSFRARTDVVKLGRGLAAVATAAVLTVTAGTVAIEVSAAVNHARHRTPWPRALEATLYRMVGSSRIILPHRVNRFLAPTMATATIGLVLALVIVLFRPVVARRLASAPPLAHTGPDDLSRARAVTARHGSGTLDYFALRPDKDFFFWGDTVVAYAVYGGVCLVSPDPIGPVAEREEAWRAFRRHVDSHGWALGGLGIGEEWLPIYRATGMHDLYVGDEAVVRVDRFSLEGGRFKGLRQAVNRIAKYGYHISFHDPTRLDPELRRALEGVMTKSRRGDVERGFSMTLGRVFDPDDDGLLLAVVHAPSDGDSLGPPVAFCQYVPAPGIGGYSLDLMRRDNGEHPNGLIDFAVVETIREVKARGGQGLGLNFATMRAVLAGEAGEGVSQRVQAWLLRRMGDSMQIESLWRFNAKFDPDWQPRYAIYDAPE